MECKKVVNKLFQIKSFYKFCLTVAGCKSSTLLAFRRKVFLRHDFQATKLKFNRDFVIEHKIYFII